MQHFIRLNTHRLFLLGALIFSVLGGGKSAAREVQEEVLGKVYGCKPGPWGELKYYYIFLEAPASYVNSFPMPSSITRWTFPNATDADLKSLFTRAGLSEAFQEVLLTHSRMIAEGGALTVFPPLPDLEAMAEKQRQVIYAELSKHDVNEFYREPVLIPGMTVDEWLERSTLRTEIVDVIRRLSYKRGDMLAFSDLSAVMNHVTSDEEARTFCKAITRTRSMILRLETENRADLPELVSYWTGYNRYKDIAPLLQSVTETEGVTRLDVIHLLPSMPRRVLYSYPAMELAIAGRMPDCHWTSLNFFNYTPKDYFLDTRLAAAHLMEAYTKVEAPYNFGDVLVFMPQGTMNAIHSCVVIADDIVFTKNGENAVSPWLFMKLEDVKRIYFPDQTGTIQAFRLKLPSK